MAAVASALRSKLRQPAAGLPLWPTLVVVSAVTMLVQLPGPHATAWHFFDDAAHLLLGDGPAGQADGLHLYRDRPDLQFGPLSILVAVPLSFLGTGTGTWVAMVAASAAGLLAFALLLDAIETMRPGFRRHVPPSVLLAAGSVLVITWGDVAVRTAHIDDAIALVAVAAALRWCARMQPGPVVIALAVAAAAKPWAIMFAPLALLPLQPGVRSGSPPARASTWLLANRAGVLRVVLIGGLVALTWAPFVLVEPATLDTTEFGITNDPTSVLRALGVSAAETPPWARPAQLLGGLALATLLVIAGRWPSLVAAAVAWRLLLDPGANRYYTVGLVLGALFLELLARRDRIPWMTIVAAVILEATAMPGFPTMPGRTLRLGCVLAALAAVALTRTRRLTPAST